MEQERLQVIILRIIRPFKKKPIASSSVSRLDKINHSMKIKCNNLIRFDSTNSDACDAVGCSNSILRRQH